RTSDLIELESVHYPVLSLGPESPRTAPPGRARRRLPAPPSPFNTQEFDVWLRGAGHYCLVECSLPCGDRSRGGLLHPESRRTCRHPCLPSSSFPCAWPRRGCRASLSPTLPAGR